MKKLFTLITLLLCAVGSSWADDVLLSYVVTADSKNGETLTAGEGTIYFGAAKFETAESPKSSSGYAYKMDGDNGTKYALLTTTKALAVGDIIEIKGYQSGSKTTGYNFCASTEGSSGTVYANLAVPNTKNTEMTVSYTIPENSGLIGKTSFYIYRNTNSIYLNAVSITRPESLPMLTGAWSKESDNIYENETAPSLPSFTVSATKNEDALTSDDYSVTYSLKEGSTNGILTIDPSTGVTAINVKVGSATVVATLSSNDEEVFKNPNPNTYEYTITVNALATQTLVSSAKTWDIENQISGSDVSGVDEFTLYANLGLTLGEEFDGTSLLVKASGTKTAWRSQYKCAQGASFQFETTVPGTVKVTFSNTGGSNSGRWVTVTDANREQTGTIEAVGTSHKNETFKIVAGTVTISETGDLRFYKIEFTPVTEVKGNITACGFNTYSSNYPIDLSTITGGTAYVATGVRDGKVVLTKCTDKIAVGTGIMIAGEADAEFKINTYAGDATFNGTNLLVGMPNGGEVPVATEGFNYVFGWTDATNPGFYKVASDVPTLPSFKAYLHTTDALTAPSNSRLAISIDGNVSTGIDDIVSSDQLTNIIFSLGGQRVAQPTKGLYIVNGKKVIIK